MRFVAMVWQVWLVSRIGEPGIGLFQLVMSVAGLSATVAVSGSRFTATRLVSEELGLDRPGGAAKALSVCTLYGLFFGLLAGSGLLLLARPIGFLWLEDARTVRPLMLLALEMPLTGLDAVMHGYFTAVGRVWKGVCISLLHQLTAIAVTAYLLSAIPAGDLEAACRGITAGRLLAAGLECAVTAVVYADDRIRHSITGNACTDSSLDMVRRALTLALPLAAAGYARSGLSTLQHLLVPVGLRASGLGAEAALSGYGVIQGMVLPAVLFPSCVMTAAAELIVPELTRRQVRNGGEDIRASAGRIMGLGTRYAFLCAAVCFSLGDCLGTVLFRSPEAGRYIRLFALLIPVMYLDTLADGCLKGLGQMMFCMYVNIADAGLSALMIWLLLPRFGLPAYIFTIFFTEGFNFLLSLWRLRRISGFRIPGKDLLLSTGTAVLSAGAGWPVSKSTSAGNGIPALVISVLVSLAAYALLSLRPGAAAGRPASW